MAQYSSTVSGLLAQVMRERGYPVVLGETVAFWECPKCHGRRYMSKCVCGASFDPARDPVRVYGPPLLIMPDHGAFRQVKTKRCLIPSGNRFCENRYSSQVASCPLASGHDPNAVAPKSAWVCAATEAEKGSYEPYASKVKCAHCGREHKSSAPLCLSPKEVGLYCPFCKEPKPHSVKFRSRPLSVWVYDPRLAVQLGSLDAASDDEEGHHHGLTAARATALPIIEAPAPPRRTGACQVSLPEALKQAVDARYRLELERNPDVGPGFRQHLETLIAAITQISDCIGIKMSPDDARLVQALWRLIGVSVVFPPSLMLDRSHGDFRRLLMPELSQVEFNDFAQALPPPSGLNRPVAIVSDEIPAVEAAGFSDLELADIYEQWKGLWQKQVLSIAKAVFNNADLPPSFSLTPLPDR